MHISLQWLQELVGFTQEPEELAELLTMAGFEVEDIDDRRTWADGVVVGRVLTREQHPNADRLSVCQVDVGEEQPLTIVCGAKNVRADIFVAVATLGTYLPKIDLKLKPTKLRGVKSQGMICSLSELGLEKDSEGIHIFAEEGLTPGQDVRPLLGLEDVIFDLTSTANRADALSMVGIAREVKALTQAPLTLPQVEIHPLPSRETLAIDLEALTACPLYIGTWIEGITIAPSPLWLQRRLQAAGVRPINNVVDVTNYVLLEWGQPLHAFDSDRLQTLSPDQSLQIGVRFARNGESLKTLDGQERSLSPTNLLITAADQPVALAGVMGGESTEVYDGTTNLLLEAAWFDPVVTRRSARAQSLRTEASSRYERGVNMAELPTACQRALDLILELAGGTIGGQAIADERAEKNPSRTISLRMSRIHQVLGFVEKDDELATLAPETIEEILTALGCHLSERSEDQTWEVTIPPYRYRDLEREIDLIEEVARLYGYDNFCDTLPSKTELGYLPTYQMILRQLREQFRGVGLTEVMHYSLVKPETGRSQQPVRLSNPLLAEYSVLRTDLVDGLIDAFQYNWEQGNGPLNAFELGHFFWSEEDGLMESEALAGILGGDAWQGRWIRSGQDQPLSWYEAKGILQSVLEQGGLSVEYQPDRQDDRFHPRRTASLWIQGTRLGRFGQLHPKLVQERGLPAEVYVFHLNLETLLGALLGEEDTVPLFQAFSTYPASDRDLAFFVNTKITVAELERSMYKAAGSLLNRVDLFDQYSGESVPEGQRSLAFRLVYRASDRTLTEEDVEPCHQKVRETLVEKFQVTLRS
ncbi:MAG: phenylalanine--tRNA ligase subunit beta [Prochlorotrichaceae cyanobacterium]